MVELDDSWLELEVMCQATIPKQCENVAVARLPGPVDPNDPPFYFFICEEHLFQFVDKFGWDFIIGIAILL